MPRLFLLGIIGLGGAGCAPSGGCPDTGQCVAAQIFVDVCATPQRQVDGVNIGGVEDCALDFGVVVDPATRPIRIANPSPLQLDVSLELDDDAFAVDDSPFTIGPGLGRDVAIIANPPAVPLVDRLLRVHSNADNTSDGGGDVVIELSASRP